jgi:hypothetical protein
VLDTRTADAHPDGPLTAIPVGTAVRVDQFRRPQVRSDVERAVDAILADSFPASDPPSWNPGVARPCPPGGTAHVASPSQAAADRGSHAFVADVLAVSRSQSERTFLQALISLAGAAGIALLVPFVILLFGAPIVLAIRGIFELIVWILSLGAW